jgi:hypothetical protein
MGFFGGGGWVPSFRREIRAGIQWVHHSFSNNHCATKEGNYLQSLKLVPGIPPPDCPQIRTAQ